MKLILEKTWLYLKSLPSSFWVALISIVATMAVMARKTSQEVVEIHKKRTRDANLKTKRLQGIQKALERQKAEIQAENEALHDSTMEAQKEITEKSNSIAETVDLVNETFGDK